jgi:hypothetical protein
LKGGKVLKTAKRAEGAFEQFAGGMEKISAAGGLPEVKSKGMAQGVDLKLFAGDRD